MRCKGIVHVAAASIMWAAFAGGASADAGADTGQPSSVSAVIEFPLPALESQLDDFIPRRLANFEDRGSECWHRFIFGREFRVDCAYEGYIERTGGIELGAENGRLTADMPVYGTVSARGIGRFVRRLRGATEARLMVYAGARPRLLSDWTVAFDIHEGFRWREPPVVRVLGFPIDLARYAEPAINRELGRVKERVEANVRSLDVREKAEGVWQRMFTPVQLSESPRLWLQITPQSVAFSGLRATGRVLEGSLAISGQAVASIGQAPPAVQPTPLPALSGDVSAPGEFDVAVPIDLTFATIETAWRDALASDTQLSGAGLKGLNVSSADGKLVIRLQLPDANTPVTLSAEPKAGEEGQTIELEGVTPAANLGVPLNVDALQALHDSLSVSFKDRIDAVLASANQRLNQQLSDGFHREGKLELGGPVSIAVLPDRIRITANARGHLRFVYDR
ncbi:MAG: DUF4403 family protein [Hyphomicrobium sp.]|uniref:DUF4403 family protein n=1 Tax=Hyphomicrobium sp. TaxID=82 RepID=UPI0039E4B883